LQTAERKERKAGSFGSFAAVSRDLSNQPRADPQIMDIVFSGGNYFGKFCRDNFGGKT